MPLATESLFGADTAPTPKKRGPKFGREVDAHGRPKAWIRNPSELSIFDIEQGLTRMTRMEVVVDKVSCDPDEATVTGTCARTPFTITARSGEDLPAVLRRLTEQLKGRRP